MTMAADRKLLDYLHEQAKEVEPVGTKRSRIMAAVVIRKSLAIFGNNAEKTDPLAKKFAKKPETEFIHAEVAAIKKAINHFRGDESKLEGATLYVARAKNNHQGEWLWGNSRPCCGCQAAIKAYGIKRVVYTLDNDEYDEEDFRE